MALRECHSKAEIVATYREARDRLWHPPSLRVVTAMPPKGAPPPGPSRPPVDHDPDAPPLRIADIPIIIRVVAGFYRVGVVEMTSPDRRVRLIVPRFMAIHLARVMTHATTTDIGRAFRRDHSTIVHALQTIEAKLATDPGVVTTVRRLRERVIRFVEQQQGGQANDEHRSS